MSRILQKLMAMYEAMRKHFGHRAWWPSQDGADTPEGKLEICLGAILTQNTSWRNVEAALDNLRAAGRLSLTDIDAMPPEQLAELIRPAGYFNVKARRLKDFAAAVRAAAGDDVAGFLDRPAETLREELLAIRGVGLETADSMILYAAGKPSFVVDAYTFRILVRHGLIGFDDDYASVKALFESSLPDDVALWNDFHAQLVETGKRFCKKRRPQCDGCPLEPFEHDPEAGMEYL
ncbi:MAG: endonuclease III domain-containing protein [Phycisphaerae bacterium]|nr:endonuclease III domain-containing protein [Phycisphaerae bacterium]